MHEKSTTGGMSRRGALLFSAMCVIWGIPYLLIKVAVEDMSPSVLVLGRTLIAAVLLLPIAAVRGELRPLRPYALAIAVFAGVEIALPWVLLGAAETEVSSSFTALLISAVPLVATVIATTTGGDRLRPANGLGLALGVLGVAAIVGLDVEGAHVVPLVEIGLVAVCYAVGPAILQRWLSHLPALGVIAVSLALTALVYLPIAALDLPAEAPSAAALGSVLALAIVCTAVAFVVFFALIAEIGPVRSTVITYVNPAVAALLGVLILHERFTVSMGVGFALVLAGSVLATRRTAAPEERPAAAPAYPGSDSIAG